MNGKGNNMKRLDLGMIIVALVTLLMATGCNNDRNTVETGEPEVVTEQVTLKCGEPFFIKVIDEYDSNVSVEYNGTDESFQSEFGLELQYTVVSDCNDCNSTVNTVDPTIPIDGNCGCGYELNDCGTVCVESQGIQCGEGTEYNETTESCELIPPLECGIGLVEEEGECIAKVYKLEEDECIEGYIEGRKGVFCFLESAIDKPSPR